MSDRNLAELYGGYLCSAAADWRRLGEMYQEDDVEFLLLRPGPSDTMPLIHRDTALAKLQRARVVHRTAMGKSVTATARALPLILRCGNWTIEACRHGLLALPELVELTAATGLPNEVWQHIVGGPVAETLPAPHGGTWTDSTEGSRPYSGLLPGKWPGYLELSSWERNARACEWLGELIAGGKYGGEDGRSTRERSNIPLQHRTRPMTMLEAARLMGYGRGRRARNNLRAAIKAGVVRVESVNRQLHIFDCRVFPSTAQPSLKS